MNQVVNRNSALEKKIENLNNTKNLLIAAGRGNLDEVRHLLEKVSVNFADENGDSVLHYAVESENTALVEYLLEKVETTDTENNKNETPLDVACSLSNGNSSKIDLVILVGKSVMKESFQLLKNSIPGSAVNDTKHNSTADREIENTKQKIEYCWMAVIKLNNLKSDANNLSFENHNNLSYEQANLLIYFLEALALAGSCDEDVKNKVRKHFAPYYDEKDWKTIKKVREHFLDEPSHKERTLEDVQKFISCESISDAFRKLEKYIELIHKCRACNKSNDRVKLSSFLDASKVTKMPKDRDKSKAATPLFLKKQFQKLINVAYRKQPVTSKELFDFIFSFYPACKQEIKNVLEELRHMRNNLIHEYHKYGHPEFGNEVYSLRSKLLKYYCAQDVLQIFSDIEPDDSPETISKNLENRLKLFQEEFKRDYGDMLCTSISPEHENSFGCVFLYSVFPEREDSIEYLVEQYLRFMAIFDREKKREEIHLSDSETEVEEGRFRYEEPHCQQKELSDVDRREIFEKFERLKRIQNNMDYCDKKQELKDELTNTYGLSAYHFDTICQSYVENNEFSEKNMNVIREIAKSINNLKKLKGCYKLSNQLFTSLYDHLLKKQTMPASAESRKLFPTVDPTIQEAIKNELPKNEPCKISIGKEIFSIRPGAIIRNMLKTFYSAYNMYQVEFNVEEIFSDAVFLDYLVRGLTEEKNNKEIDFQIWLTVFIHSKGCRVSEKGEIMSIREVLQDFSRLKMFKNHCSDQDYCKEKENFKAKILKEIGLKECDFDTAHKFFVENGLKLQEDDVKEIAKVQEILIELKNFGKSWQTTWILYQKLIEAKVKGNEMKLDEDPNLPGISKGEQKTLKKKLEKLYADRDLAESEVNVVSLQVKSLTYKVVYNMLEILKEQRQLEKPYFIYMIVKKLLNIDYCVPYIVKLITEVKNDAIIEKGDLLHLVDILLKKEEGFYIKHLHALLDTGSRKLNLYEEICRKILEHGINVENLRMVFKDAYHTKGILDVIKKNSEKPFDAKEPKGKKFIISILELLNNIAYEFYRSNHCTDASKLLEAASGVQEKLIHDNTLHKTDLNVLQTEFHMGKISNKLGMQENNKTNKVIFHESALSKFRSIRETLKYQNSDDHRERRDVKVLEMPLLLLIQGEIAYTIALLEKYTKSCTKHEKLCQRVAKFALGYPPDEALKAQTNSNIEVLDAQMYSEIEKSKRYEMLLNFSEESKKYLDILNIKSTMAFYKVRQARVELEMKRSSVDAQPFLDALKIYQDVYSIKKRKMELVYQTVIPTMSHISYVLGQIGYAMKRNEKPMETLHFFYRSLEKENKAYRTKNGIFWPNHQAVLNSRTRIMNALKNIAMGCSAAGRKAEALNIFEELCGIQVRLYEKDEKEQHRIATTNYHMTKLYCHFRRWQEAGRCASEVREINKEQLGANHPKTREMDELISQITREQQANSETGPTHEKRSITQE